MPRWNRRRLGTRVMSRSKSVTAPRSGFSSPVMRLKSVVLPAPFGPMMSRRSPGSTARLTAEVTRSPPNDLSRPLTASAGTRSSGERQRLTVQVFGALHLDEDREAFLVRVAILLGLHEAPPDLFVRRARPVDLRCPVEPRDTALGQHAGLAQLGLAKEHGHLAVLHEVGVRRALASLPQRQVVVVVDHRAAARRHLGEPVR